ncbi:MAG: ATP-binding cassette domain-containing protein [Rhodopseudomonas sp.]|nr:ATP-binding cassette domain-containing protein [Rhodopseudomonas sp.]
MSDPLTISEQALIDARGVVVAYGGQRSAFGRAKPEKRVLHGVDVVIGRGQTVGIVGESGSGKTTLGRALLGLVPVADGSIRFDRHEIVGLKEDALRPLRKRMQMIFQDPMSSLNPRHDIRHILIAPLLLHGLARDRREAEVQVRAVLDRVGLPASALERYPHELSGGQRQRVGIARAVVLAPDFVLADEIVSGLDVSTQAQVLQLLGELKRDMNLSMAFISHDLSVVRAVCDRVYVLSGGRVVEQGACEQVFASPHHDYTKVLIDAIPLPVIDPQWLGRGQRST